jgi:hypothetical protein
MTHKADEYRRRAKEAEQQAEAVTDPEAKRAYWGLADSYKELARLAERQHWP